KQAKRPALTRAMRVRRRLGALPSLLAPVPPKPKHWPRVHYVRLVAELAAAESVIAGMLRATVAAVKRRRRSFDRHGNRGTQRGDRRGDPKRPQLADGSPRVRA